jgi:putative peptide zinc metalloprotease protein
MFAPDSRVRVHPFSLQPDGDELVIGRAGGSYISVPAEAVEILRGFEAGKTLAEVEELFFERHGERPELAEFLAGLHSRGFVEPEESGAIEAGSPAAALPAAGSGSLTTLSGLLFGRAALGVYLLVVLAAAAAAVVRPDIIPGRSSLFFPRHRTLNGLLLLLLAYASVFVHEMGHLLAARSVGVRSRIGISHRLWIVVAETDLTGLWGIPRRRRYLPLLAGCVVDLVSAALLMLVLFAAAAGRLGLSATRRQFVSAMVFVYFMRILWQCYLFLRTDFYYVIGALTGCKNLMDDTQAFLRNQLTRWRPAMARADQSAIPRREMRVIRLYAGIWVVGRLLAFAVLFAVSIPLTVYYIRSLGAAVRLGVAAHPYPFLDSLFVTATFVVPLSVGMTLWIRSLVKTRRVQP